MRRPLVAGVAGGVGTTTVAVALAATDCGVYRRGSSVDVVVCRDAVASIGNAHRVVNAAVGPPLLLVVPSAPGKTPRAAAARVEMVRPHVTGVRSLPWVAQWREVADPWSQAASVLPHRDQVPKWLREFATKIHEIHAVLLEQLHHAPAPPSPPPGMTAPPVPAAPPSLST